MKFRILISILNILFLYVSNVYAQEDQKGPLDNYKFIRKPQDVAVFGYSSSNYSIPAQRLYDFQYFPGRGDSIVLGPDIARLDTLPMTGHTFTDMVTGNFLGDSRDEVAAAWETGNRSVVLAISNTDRLTNEWHDISVNCSDSLSLINIPYRADNYFGYDYFGYRIIRLESANFDSDPEDELVLAYWAADSTLKIELYDGASGFTQPKAVISDQKLSTWLPRGPGDGWFNMFFFDITVGDFDEDGLGEILLTGKEPDSIPSVKMFAAVYDYNSITSTFTLKTKTNVPHGITQAFNDRIRYIYATAGRMNKKYQGDGFISISLADSFHHPYRYAMLSFDVSSDLSGISFGAPQNLNYIRTFFSTDVNNDGFDETFAITRDSLIIMTIDTSFTARRMFATRATPFDGSIPSNTYFYYPSRRSCVVADIDSDTSKTRWMPELIIGEEAWPYLVNPTYRLCVYDVGLDTTGNVNGLQLRMWKNGYPPEKMAVGNFNGGDIRLGVPGHYFKTDILQPIVILNAPPVHFDVFNGTKYDISKSYSPNTCQFISRYEKKSQSSVEVQTKVSRSWATSESFGGVLSYMGIGANLSFEQRYGENFSKEDGSSRTVTISVQVDAKEDDEIYATVVDYDIWEYPVYAEDTLVGHVLVMDPLQVSNRWFPSKSWSGSSYIPNHEVGNILSYQRYPSLIHNEDVASLISGTYDQSYTLHASSSYDWNLQFQDFVNSQTETTKKIGFDVGGGGSFFGISIGGKETYDRENVSTHKTSVTQDLLMSTHLDAVDLGIGEVRYTVTPYSYWAKNGALVIDYAVQPDLALPGYTPTWWQRHYDSIPDPAFILPWRLDPEKGFALEDDAKRYQTNEIIFSKNEPVAGDTITIRARIHNFSLSPTIGLVKVRFYVGDPDSGGTLISGIHGETEVLTDSLIRSREKTNVQMQWQIPAGLSQYPRIYAVIDPDGDIEEIHESNNKGFSVLGKTQLPPDEILERLNAPLPTEYALAQNYPNPFNPSTMINYQMPMQSYVTLKVFDIIGREVATLVNGIEEPGYKSVRFDAPSLSSGVYYYRLQAGNYIETKKLLLLR
jgi:hypothetical protein